MRLLPRGLGPRSLGGQMTGLLLIALLVAQVITTLLFVDERRGALIEAGREQVLLRAASLVALIDATPPELHASILRAARDERMVFSIDDSSAVPGTIVPTPRERRIRDQLALLIGFGRPAGVEIQGEAASRPPLAATLAARLNGELETVPGPPGVSDRVVLSQGPPGPPSVAVAGRPLQPEAFAEQGLTVSIALDDGQWLNVATVLPGSGPPLAPTFISTGVMAVAMVIVVLILVTRIARPLHALADASERLGRGETVEHLPETGPQELRLTTRAFNAMQERLSRFVNGRTRMLAAISHDLRTPITALRLRAEFVDDAETRDRLVETLDELARMTESVLAFAHEEATTEETRVIDLGGLAEAAAADFADLGHDVTFTGRTGIAYACRPLALKRAIRNLIENAVRYGRAACVAVDVTPDGPRVVVEDEGPGIPPDKLSEVAEPFVRLESSRNAATGGVGLGLSITKSVIQAHGGELILENRVEGGLRAVIALPPSKTRPAEAA